MSYATIRMVAVLYLIWGLTLLVSSAPLMVAPVHMLIRLTLISPATAGVFFILAGICAWIGIYAPKRDTLYLLLPQSISLVLACWGAMEAVMIQHSPDGAFRSHFTMLAAQAPIMVVTAFHSISAVLNYRSKSDYC